MSDLPLAPKTNRIPTTAELGLEPTILLYDIVNVEPEPKAKTPWST